MEFKNFVLCFIVWIVFCILFDVWHRYAYKRCVRNCRCREWLCKYFHECDYSCKRVKKITTIKIGGSYVQC